MDKLNLKKRGEVWYINIAVPRPLIEAVGKTHYTETTSTRDIHQARAYRDIRVPEIKKELAQYRTSKAPIAKPKDSQKLTLESLTESAKALRDQIIDSSDAMDSKTASEAFSYMVDNYCQTKKVTEGEVVKIRQASKLLSNWNRELLTDLIETHVTELKRHVVTSTAKARSTKLMSLADFLGKGAFVDEVKKVDLNNIPNASKKRARVNPLSFSDSEEDTASLSGESLATQPPFEPSRYTNQHGVVYKYLQDLEQQVRSVSPVPSIDFAEPTPDESVDDSELSLFPTPIPSPVSQVSRVCEPLPVDAKRILSQWYDQHVDHPYPSKMQKSELAMACNLSVRQVSGWFGNTRAK